MGKRDVLTTLVGGGEGSGQAARDIDWMTVRRVQHGIGCGPAVLRESAACTALGGGGERLRARRLAHALAFVIGVLLGLVFLQGLTRDILLVLAFLSLVFLGVIRVKVGSR